MTSVDWWWLAERQCEEVWNSIVDTSTTWGCRGAILKARLIRNGLDYVALCQSANRFILTLHISWQNLASKNMFVQTVFKKAQSNTHEWYVSRVPQSAGLSWESWLYLIRISTPLVMTISDYRIVKVHYSHLNWQNVFDSVKNSFVDISCLSLQLGWNDSQILCILLKLILNVLMDQLNLGL